MKFKVGDIVEIDEDSFPFFRHYTGIVAGFTNNEIRVSVDGSKATYYYFENELRHIRIANTPITRKLYPHYKEDGEWLIITEKNS